MANNTDLSSEILHQIVENGHDNITVDNDSFFLSLSSGSKQKFQKRSARLTGLMLVMILSACFVLYGAIFYIQNVLLFNPTIHVNQFGTFIRTSYNSEYAMFLFNPFEPWAASGVQVQENDRLFISASGAYHTNYGQLVAATQENRFADLREYYSANGGLKSFNPHADKPYRYVYATTPPDSITPNKPLAIDRTNLKTKQPFNLKDSALFGDVLLQIVPENKMRDTLYQEEKRIYAIPRTKTSRKETMQMQHTGVISFGVNDNNPFNNIGQILVVMEIYRSQKHWTAFRHIFYGRILEYPYFWYDFWSHKGYPVWATILFLLIVTVEFLLFCALAYALPFLFFKDTWTNKRTKNMKTLKTLILAFSAAGFIACTQQHLTPETWQDCGFATQEDMDTLDAWFARNDTEQLRLAFDGTISFGTAGLRDVMSPGTNRMNMYSVARATQGFANYLKRHTPERCSGVVVGYDCRHNSKEFAQMTADVFSANGIPVYLFESMRPTPEISFAIRELKCAAGVNITASHNRKEFNGYKAYWCDGGQLVPPQDEQIIRYVKRITRPQDIRCERNDQLIHLIGAEMDAKYIALAQTALLDTSLSDGIRNLRIAYSPMHGAGYEIVPKTLEALGVKEVSLVQAQLPDGGLFASVQRNKKQEANPEDTAAMGLLLQQAMAMDADMAVATDPDADRFGFICKDKQGTWHFIDGHQSTMLFTDYIIRTRQRLGLMPEKPFMGRTIVTSDIVKHIAEEAGITMYDEYTGFKWLANRIEITPGETFIGAGEESYCYLPYADVRDKDAPASICLLAEMTADAQRRNTTLWDDLMAIYQHFGFQCAYTVKEAFELNGRSLAEAKKTTMEAFRNNLKTILGEPAECIDYNRVPVAQNERHMLTTADVLQYFTPSGMKITVRPSGTEPSIKFYMEIPCADFKDGGDYEQACRYTDKLQGQILDSLNKILCPPQAHPYFTVPQMPNALHYLPGPPMPDEMRFAYDTAQYNWGKRMRPTPRGEKAKLDAEYSIARMARIFSPVMGIEISQTNTPQIWTLLTDATKTTDFACDSAKITYMRPRPYMVFNEPTLIPEDEEALRKNGSYPSGHTTLGWTTALILCEINPDAQDAILKEGFEYGQSRVIAGYHWQSDVDMARVVASAAFARLHTSEAYLNQLRKAQREYANLKK